MPPPAYTWPLSGAAARSVALTPFSTGMVAADWLAQTLWPFNGNAFTPPIVLASGTTPGLSDMAPDAASGVWAVSYTGTLWHQPATGTATAISLPANAVYTGCAFVGGQPYVSTAIGNVLTSGGVIVANWPTAVNSLTGSGGMLAALLVGQSVGTMTTAGVTGSIALPAGISTASCLSVGSGQPVAIAGWQTAPALAGAAAAILSPVDPTVMLAVGSGTATLWRAASGLSDAWNQTQALAGLASLTSIGWAPDGFHALACAPAAGSVQVLSYAAGVIALIQTLSVAGAAAVAVCPGNALNALVAQPGPGQLISLVNTGTWTTGSAVTGLPGVNTVLPYGASGAVAGYASGLAYLTLATGGWQITNRQTLTYAPSVITQDPFGNVYAAGSGLLSVVAASGAGVTGSGAWTGAAPTGSAIEQGRLLLAVPSDGFLYEFGQATPGVWSIQTSNVLSAGASVGLGLSDTTLFVMGAASTTTYGFSGTPFVLTSPVSGAVAQRVGGSWISTPLGVGQTPMAICYDQSNNLRVATSQNTLWTITSGGTVLSSGAVPQYSTQPQSVPLGISSLLAFGAGVYGATSLSGTLVQVA